MRSSFVWLFAPVMLATTGARAEESNKTFYADILPVFQKYCIECHRVGGVAPQSLETYEQARSWLRTSRQMMREKTMPPWHAEEGAATWRNAVLPTDEEIELVSSWVKAGAEPGDETAAPPPLDFSADWKLGEPHTVFTMPEAVEIRKGDPDVYRNTVFDPGFDEDTWLDWIEFKPGANQVVRQLALSVMPPDVADSLPVDAFNLREFEGKHDLAAWNRGMTLIEPYPEGSGVLVPAGWKLVLHAHYKAGEEGGADRSSLAFRKADTAPAAEFVTLAAENRDFTLPANSYDYKVEATTTLDRGLRLESVLPKMHYIAMDMDVDVTPPGGDTRPLIKVRYYDYGMQTLYTLAEPIELPAGTRINVRAFYENSLDNPNNPSIDMAPVPYGPAPAGEIVSVVLRGVAL